MALAAAASPAQAGASLAASAIFAPSAVYSAIATNCSAPGLAVPAAAITPAANSKSAAILGGSPSKLELMRMQQASANKPAFASNGADDSSALARAKGLQPALGATRSMPSFCAESGAADTSALAATKAIPDMAPAARDYSRDDFLASKRVTIRRTMFDKSWNRVRADGISNARLTRYLGASRASGVELLEQVNSWANHRIRYVEDRNLYGKADHWADARTTLSLGKGDCEDIAILKMQMLAAAGVRREDMFLTIARDLARNADHALLVVRMGGEYYLLDNAVDSVLDASASNDYRPVISFNDRTSWLHGY